MDISIHDLYAPSAETLFSYEVEQYAHIVRRPSHYNDTFDIDLTVTDFSVNSSGLSFRIPSGVVVFVPISSDNYHKIEVF